MSDTLEQLEAEFAEAGQAERELALLEKILPLSPRRALELATKTLDLYREIRDKENIPFALLFIANCHFRLTDYPSALSDVAEAQTYFNKSKNKIGIARCHRLIGEVHLRSGEYAQALEHLVKALEVFEEEKIHVRVIMTLNAIANCYQKLGNYSLALQHYLRSLDKMEPGVDDSEIAVNLNGIGTMYMHLNDFGKAEEYFNRSLDLNVALNNQSGRASVLTNLGKLYEFNNKLESALENLLSALEIQRELGNKYVQAIILNFLGSVQEAMGDVEQAKNSFQIAFEIGESISSDEIRGAALGYLGRLLYKVGELNEAIEKLNKAVDFVKQTGQKSSQYRIHRVLSNCWNALGNKESALEHLELYASVKDELFSQEKQRLIAERQASFEIERAKKEKEIFRLKAEQAEKEMEFKNKELTVMAMTLVQKNELLARLKLEIKAISASVDEESSSLRKTILAQIEEGINSENDWQVFEQHFKNVHEDFNTILSHRFPKLTPTELKVCSLIKTGLTSKEIANMLFITHRTVELHRTRIRKKMELPHSTNLTSYLASLGGDGHIELGM